MPQRPSAVGAAVWAQTNRPAPIAAGDWVNINREPGATRFSPLTQINPGNVARLQQAWTLPMGGGGSSVPLVVDGVVYVSSGRCVVAIDGDTGKEVWAYTIEAAAPPAGAPAAAAPAAPPAPCAHQPQPVVADAGRGAPGGGGPGGGRAAGADAAAARRHRSVA